MKRWMVTESSKQQAWNPDDHPEQLSGPQIGSRVAKYRAMAGISAQQLADRSGHEITRSVVANIETGRRENVTIAQAFALAMGLQVPPAALLLPLEAPYSYVKFAGGQIRVVDALGWMQSWSQFPFDYDHISRSPTSDVLELIMAIEDVERLRARQEALARDVDAARVPEEYAAERRKDLEVDIERALARLTAAGATDLG